MGCDCITIVTALMRMVQPIVGGIIDANVLRSSTGVQTLVFDGFCLGTGVAVFSLNNVKSFIPPSILPLIDSAFSIFLRLLAISQSGGYFILDDGSFIVNEFTDNQPPNGVLVDLHSAGISPNAPSIDLREELFGLGQLIVRSWNDIHHIQCQEICNGLAFTLQDSGDYKFQTFDFKIAGQDVFSFVDFNALNQVLNGFNPMLPFTRLTVSQPNKFIYCTPTTTENFSGFLQCSKDSIMLIQAILKIIEERI
jgi:hypothetical protein